MDEIVKLIDFIEKKYLEISIEWTKDDRYYPLNMRLNRVEHIYNDEKLLTYVFNYRTFINEYTINITDDIQELGLTNTVNTRVKALNSIQDKIARYENKKEQGKIPIKKCLNDIFGIRIILNENIPYDEIIEYIKKKYNKLKCIKANRGKYKAVHIYFGNDDNFKFQWELQIWNKEDEHENLISHAKYKQEYTKWEKENK